MSQHHQIDAELIAAVAAQTGAREIDVKRCALGLPTLDGSDDRIVAALVSAGVDADFLRRLRGLSRLVPASTEAA